MSIITDSLTENQESIQNTLKNQKLDLAERIQYKCMLKITAAMLGAAMAAEFIRHRMRNR